MTIEVVNPLFVAVRPRLPLRTAYLHRRSELDIPEYRIAFDMIQAIRVTAEDAYPFTGSKPQGLAEVMGSAWLMDLTRSSLGLTRLQTS